MEHILIKQRKRNQTIYTQSAGNTDWTVQGDSAAEGVNNYLEVPEGFVKMYEGIVKKMDEEDAQR